MVLKDCLGVNVMSNFKEDDDVGQAKWLQKI